MRRAGWRRRTSPARTRGIDRRGGFTPPGPSALRRSALTPVFLYGTLLDRRILARRSGDPGLPRAMRPAVLNGFRRVVFRGTPYPTLVPSPHGQVEGALIRPAASAVAALRRYEGACYRLIPIRVHGPRGPVLARAWVVPRRMAGERDWP
ncbi:gamma-glutamylcyclotransferase family protein [Roseomonas populi]|uniref:gamma-glutamylcyclotransferase family protein n=1 Tax=Roseomonas populi TaxID=3121582 RepID=UPI0038CDC6FF